MFKLEDLKFLQGHRLQAKQSNAKHLCRELEASKHDPQAFVFLNVSTANIQSAPSTGLKAREACERTRTPEKF